MHALGRHAEDAENRLAELAGSCDLVARLESTRRLVRAITGDPSVDADLDSAGDLGDATATAVARRYCFSSPADRQNQTVWAIPLAGKVVAPSPVMGMPLFLFDRDVGPRSRTIGLREESPAKAIDTAMKPISIKYLVLHHYTNRTRKTFAMPSLPMGQSLVNVRIAHIERTSLRRIHDTPLVP